MSSTNKIIEEKKTYLKVAVNNISADYILDSWWMFLADKGLWVSQHGTLSEAQRLDSLESSYLYSIKKCIMRLSGDAPLGPGASKLIAIILKILDKRDKEEGEPLPF